MSRKITLMDPHQIQQVSFDEEKQAIRVTLVDGSVNYKVSELQPMKETVIEKVEVPVKETVIEKIEVPVKETVIEKIEVPVVVKETVVEKVEVPVVVKETVIEKVEVPVIIKETDVKFVEQGKEVIVKEEKSKLDFNKIVIITQTIIIILLILNNYIR